MSNLDSSNIFPRQDVDYTSERRYSLVSVVYERIGRLKVESGSSLTSPGQDETDHASSSNLFSLVSASWGEKLNSSTQGLSETRLLLVDVSPTPTSDVLEQKINSKSHSAQICRWKGSRLLVKFDTDEDVKIFCNEMPFSYSSLQTALSTQVIYPCFVHIPQPSSTKAEFCNDVKEAILTPFAGNLFMHVSESSANPETTINGGKMPRTIILFSLSTKLPTTHSRYQSMCNQLNSKNWLKIDRVVHKLENSQLFVHKLSPSVGFAVRLSSGMSSGIQYVLNTSSQSSMEECKKFYSTMFSTQPLVETDASQVDSVTFPLGNRYCEFMLRFDAAVTMPPPSKSSLCLYYKSLSHLSPLGLLPSHDSTAWQQITDPDGNSLSVTSPLS
ncbi:hypothetical protein EB796_020136 [Bugula neritina]|uniref:Uncharacterized protein n=1 Tax=Bugula neritina TaxID=10212 RepID=A0A7J7J7B6_BUGNE|nr:hypothetical protein EB796_020136 [Bugula neritina]